MTTIFPGSGIPPAGTPPPSTAPTPAEPPGAEPEQPAVEAGNVNHPSGIPAITAQANYWDRQGGDPDESGLDRVRGHLSA
jgi:hypothetical protein